MPGAVTGDLQRTRSPSNGDYQAIAAGTPPAFCWRVLRAQALTHQPLSRWPLVGRVLVSLPEEILDMANDFARWGKFTELLRDCAQRTENLVLNSELYARERLKRSARCPPLDILKKLGHLQIT